MSWRRCQVAVVGAGPAGIAAACRAAEAGRSVVVLDEGFGPGGQVWRHGLAHAAPEAARPWLLRLSRAGAAVETGAAVFEARAAAGGFRVRAEQRGRALDLLASRLVLAPGARERFLPFEGWTLPGVTGAGGLQALHKAGLAVAGEAVVLAGSGPLLLQVAAGLQEAGAAVKAVAEQAPASALAGFALRLLSHPAKLAEGARYRQALGARYRTGWWVARALGRERLEAAVLTDGRRSETIPCHYLGVSHGLVANLELPRFLGAAVERGAVQVDASQQTRLPGLYAAGEACGVAGLDAALAEGQIAGLAAAGAPAEKALAEARRAARSLAEAMERAFALRPELRAPPPPEVVVCRCEDVRAGDLDPAWGVREAKLATRAGMGACQGRVCGPALACLHDHQADAPRSPLKPVSLSTLLEEEDP